MKRYIQNLAISPLLLLLPPESHHQHLLLDHYSSLPTGLWFHPCLPPPPPSPTRSLHCLNPPMAPTSQGVKAKVLGVAQKVWPLCISLLSLGLCTLLGPARTTPLIFPRLAPPCSSGRNSHKLSWPYIKSPSLSLIYSLQRPSICNYLIYLFVYVLVAVSSPRILAPGNRKLHLVHSLLIHSPAPS